MSSKAEQTSSKEDTACSKDAEALQAVRQDPAVLEALIRVDKRNTPSPAPEVEELAYQTAGEENELKNNGPEVAASVLQFEETVRLQKAAVLSLEPSQLDLLLQYAGVLRLQRQFAQNHGFLECVFCKKNGKEVAWYSTHMLKDTRGRVRCPVLRGYRCPACGATGDRAHTIKYCPENRHGDRWSR